MAVRQVYIPPVHYPESDGAPMGETEIHIMQIIALVLMLRDFFASRQDVFVGANMFLYYVEGNPHKVVAPDVFVVLGIPKKVRDVFRVWEEKVPDVVIEVTSASTRVDDMGSKKGLYEELGVREYFIFDPRREYLEPQLVGFRLGPKGYERESGWSLESQVLGLRLVIEPEGLRLYNSETGEPLLRHEEVIERARQEALRAEQEARRANQAEAEIERLKAELAKLSEDNRQD